MEQQAAIEVTTEYESKAGILVMTSPRLQVDDEPPVRGRWGTAVVPVSAGRHQVRCWFRWGFWPRCGRAGIDVDVPYGSLVRLRYTAPSGYLLKPGRWTTAL